METITTADVRRLALARAGLLKPEWTAFPSRGAGRGRRARDAALRVVDRFGYLQLDTVSIAGARSHAIVLLSRLDGFDPDLGEALLRPGAPLFEYWGHEASWIPLSLYACFEWRRRAYRSHPWWGDLVSAHPEVADALLRRIRDDGPIRSVDMEGKSGSGWWNLKLTKKVATALWSSGDLAIRERRNFQRTYDLAERVIPRESRARTTSYEDSLDELLLRALDGHGWATSGTLVRTWRLHRRGPDVAASLRRLSEAGHVVACTLVDGERRRTAGWIRPGDLELLPRLTRVRPRSDRGVLLSPFDPLLWERERVARLFGFDQVLEIFKPAPKRVYGYYCLPVLAGERLVARFDLKADRAARKLDVLRVRFEGTGTRKAPRAADSEAARTALARYAGAVGLSVRGYRTR